jgi:hypothetical protein
MIILVVVVLALFGLSMYLLNNMTKIKKFAYLVQVMAACGSKPMGIIVDRSGTAIPFVSEPDERNKGLIKNDYTIVNPDLIKSSTKRASRLKFRNGPETLIYPLPFYFPMDIHDAAALCQLARKIRKHPDFSWISNERRLLELIFNGTETFEEDCRTLVSTSISADNVVPEEFYTDPEPEPEYEEEEEEFEEVEEEEEEELEEVEDEEKRQGF